MGATAPFRTSIFGVFLLVASGAAHAGELGEPSYVEVSHERPLGLELHAETRCEKTQPLKRLAGEDPKWPQVPGVALHEAVQVRCVVLKDGTVRQCRMSGPSRLDRVVLDAVKQWKFEPYKKRGVPAPVTYLFTLYTDKANKPRRPAFGSDPSTRIDSWGQCLFDTEEVLSNTPADRGPLSNMELAFSPVATLPGATRPMALPATSALASRMTARRNPAAPP
jgi:TonB family protein